LRQEFLSAEMGISGANFMVAETGTIVLVTNEGNGRMCTTLPPLHVAVVGIDKVVPDWESLTVLLKLLARNATGQKISTYTSFITGPRRSGGEGGPREFHLVLLDNGRTRVLQDRVARDTLLCIRCGACANVCPVYNTVGGHAYGGVYSGPIGAILAPQLVGTAIAGDLPFASSLCGACADICPVKIPIPEILLHLRHRVVEGDAIERAVASPITRATGRIGAIAFGMPALYGLGARMMRIVQTPFLKNNWLTKLPPPMNRWTMARPLPRFRNDFRAWWRKRGGAR
jgi:L-lactate dehydrogenase complex protein LldF